MSDQSQQSARTPYRVLNESIAVKMCLRDVIGEMQCKAITLDDLGRGEYAEKIRDMAVAIEGFVVLEDEALDKAAAEA